MKISYEKLVRDKIPEIIQNDGKQCKIKTLNDHDYLVCLKQKLVEEAKEVCETVSMMDLKEELADILEVIDAIQTICKIKDEEIICSKQNKSAKNGAFHNRIFLEYVEATEHE